jgi:hypothetical protein
LNLQMVATKEAYALVRRILHDTFPFWVMRKLVLVANRQDTRLLCISDRSGHPDADVPIEIELLVEGVFIGNALQSTMHNEKKHRVDFVGIDLRKGSRITIEASAFSYEDSLDWYVHTAMSIPAICCESKLLRGLLRGDLSPDEMRMVMPSKHTLQLKNENVGDSDIITLSKVFRLAYDSLPIERLILGENRITSVGLNPFNSLSAVFHLIILFLKSRQVSLTCWKCCTITKRSHI